MSTVARLPERGTSHGPISEARRLLDLRWSPDEPVAVVESWLLAHTDCTDREVSILVAERAAADRLRAGGLDPAGARRAADLLLLRSSDLANHHRPRRIGASPVRPTQGDPPCDGSHQR